MSSLLGAGGDRKVTLGITGSSRARAPIDPAVWYLDVGSSHPGSAAGAKGGAARPLKGNVSWVYTVVRQVGLCLTGAWLSEGKLPLVREDQGSAASGLSVVRQGKLSR